MQKTDTFERPRLHAVSTFIRNVSYQVYVTCLLSEFHVGRCTGCWNIYRRDSFKATEMQFESAFQDVQALTYWLVSKAVHSVQTLVQVRMFCTL